MQRDAVEGDHETNGGEHDGRDPPSLFPDSLFKAGVGAFDDGFEVFVHAGLHEFSLGGGDGLNGAGQRRGLDFGKACLFQLFHDGQSACHIAWLAQDLRGRIACRSGLSPTASAFLPCAAGITRQADRPAGAAEDGCEPMGVRSGGGVRAPYFSCRRASVASSRLRVASGSSQREMSITFAERSRRLTARSTSENVKVGSPKCDQLKVCSRKTTLSVSRSKKAP